MSPAKINVIGEYINCKNWYCFNWYQNVNKKTVQLNKALDFLLWEFLNLSTEM